MTIAAGAAPWASGASSEASLEASLEASRAPAFGFGALAAAVEAEIVGALDLRPLPLDPGLARAEGRWKGAPVQIETSRYAGGVLRYARFARVTGVGLDIGNVLCCPRVDVGLPVFGADLVAANPRRGLVVADLSPTLPPGPARDAQLAPIAALAPIVAALPPGGDVPAWCAAWLSPWALYTRLEVAAAPAACAAVGRLAHSFIGAAHAAAAARDAGAERGPLVAAAQDAYVAAHRAADPSVAFLGTLFGAPWAAAYVADVLFPLPTSARC